jgi:hypothetical protein
LEKNQPEWEKYYDKPPLWKNKMFMPEWASRCKLEITGVGAERLQDISEEDAVKEGIKKLTKDGELFKFAVYDRGDYSSVKWQDMPRSPIPVFAQLIDRINGSGTWDSDPWCWVYEFRRVS